MFTLQDDARRFFTQLISGKVPWRRQVDGSPPVNATVAPSTWAEIFRLRVTVAACGRDAHTS